MNSRGVAVPETAMIIGMAMILIFGIVQLVLLAFAQSSAIGAAFAGAHNAAINQSSSQSQAYTTAVQPAFPNVQSTEFSLTQTTHGTVLGQVSKTAPGLAYPGGAALYPGAQTTVQVNGFDEEPFTSTSGVPSPSALAVQASLGNFCNGVGGACSSPGGVAHPMYISQYDDLTNAFNGNNGQFGEWSCRYNMYSSLVQGANAYFPAVMPTPGANYDPGNAAFGTGSGADNNPPGKNQTTAPVGNNQAALYYWDSKPAVWGTEGLC